MTIAQSTSPGVIRQPAPAIVGLVLAWGGTGLLVSPPAGRVADPSRLSGAVVGHVALWLLLAAVVAIVLFWEKQRLRSLWLKPSFEWPSLGWAVVLGLFSVLVLFPITEWVREAAGLPGYGRGMETVLASPAWLRVLAVLTAGIVEETLFRGFAVTRLLRIGASVPVAIVLSSAVFAALHLPLWGPGPSLAFFVGGIATTGFFVWRRDLLAMIVAHVAIDMWGLVIAPAAGPWWS